MADAATSEGATLRLAGAVVDNVGEVAGGLFDSIADIFSSFDF